MTTHRLSFFTRLLAGVLLTAIVAHAAPGSGRWFARPFVSYIGATDKSYSDAGSVGAAVGVTLGADAADEFAFEGSGFHYRLDAPFGGSAGGETFLPTLLTYRHYFAPETAFARFYIGAGAGVTEVYTHLDYSGYGYRVHGDDTAFPFTAEGSIGVALRLSNVVTLDVGYRYLHIESHRISLSGYSAGSGGFVATTSYGGAFEANTAYVGVGIRF